jgi:hypothetical protein
MNTSIPLIVTLTLAYYSEEESGGSITLKHLPTSFSLPWLHLQSHSPLPPLLSAQPLSHPPSPSTTTSQPQSQAETNTSWSCPTPTS